MTLRNILQGFQHAYIIMDALDECTERDTVLKLIEDIVNWNMDTVHILVTSRKEQEIEDCLSSQISYTVDMQESVVAQDIEIHVRTRLQEDQILKRWPANVKAVLTERAHGIFRYVACQLGELRKYVMLSELRDALKCLPNTLDDTYERILNDIDRKHRSGRVRKLLQWLCFSLRPVKLDEVVEVLAVTFDHFGYETEFDPEDRYPGQLEYLREWCSSLVSFCAEGENRGVVRLAHFSVKEYLVSTRIRNSTAPNYRLIEKVAHRDIARACLAYLLHFKTADCLNKYTIEDYPLAEYAARYWVDHAWYQGDTFPDNLESLVIELFEIPGPVGHILVQVVNGFANDDPQYLTHQFVNWVRIYDFERPFEAPNFDRHPDDIPSKLYYAVLLGTFPAVQGILQRKENINEVGGHFGNAIHGGVVRLLLDHGADINFHGGFFGIALRLASAQGHEEIVRLLLERGVDANSLGEYRNALELASDKGHVGVVRLLLDYGADDSLTYNGSALELASAKGHVGVVRLLLDYGANAKVRGRHHHKALNVANGQKEIVRLLLVDALEMMDHSSFCL